MTERLKGAWLVLTGRAGWYPLEAREEARPNLVADAYRLSTFYDFDSEDAAKWRRHAMRLQEEGWGP